MNSDIERAVNPEHYKVGKIEPIKYIQDHQFNFALGNVIKYVTRAGYKNGNSKLQDLYKAKQYIQMEIAVEEKTVKSAMKPFNEEDAQCK